jgi:hypothetical protein
MPRLICAAVLFACVTAVYADDPASTAPASRPTPPVVDAKTYLTQEDLKKYFDQKLYDFVTAQIGKIQLNKKVYETYDPGELLKLKAESLLQSNRNRQLTIDTFKEAAKAYRDDKKGAVCMTLAFLVEKNPTGKYTRKTVDGKPAPTGTQAPPPIPFNDYSKRGELFTALFEDEFINVEPAMKKAMPATALKPLADAAVIVGNARTFELAATLDDVKTAGSCKELAQRAADLIDLAMERHASQITAINQNANMVINYQVTGYDPVIGQVVNQNRQRRTGPTKQEAATLNGIIAEADQSVAAVNEFTERLRAGNIMQKTALSATKISGAAKSVLTADYSFVGR